MNLGTLNGFALNASALATWVKAALVAASVGCDATASARIIYGAISTLSAGGSGEAQQYLTKAATSTLSGGANGSGWALQTQAGNSTATGTCAATVFVYREVVATVSATAGATGEALPDDQLGLAEPSASLDGSAVGTKIQFTMAALSAGGDGEAWAQFGGPVLGNGTAWGLAEPAVQLSGETIYRHDGFVWAEASATATAAETHWQWITANAVTPTTDLVGMAQAYKTQPAQATLSGGLQEAVADFRNVLYGDANATVGMGGAAAAVRYYYPTTTATVGATGNEIDAWRNLAGRAQSDMAGADGSATAVTRSPGRATASAGADAAAVTFARHQWSDAEGMAAGAATVTAVMQQLGTVMANGTAMGVSTGSRQQMAFAVGTLGCGGSAWGLTNIEVPAPTGRTLTVTSPPALVVTGTIRLFSVSS